MIRISRKIQQLFVVIILLLFGMTVFLNLTFMDLGMAISPDGSMSNCPFNVNGSVCDMGFKEHLNALKLAFIALPPKIDFIKTLLLKTLLLLIVLSAVLAIHKSRLLSQGGFSYSRQLTYAKSADISIFNPIKEAFSRGIINPKIF